MFPLSSPNRINLEILGEDAPIDSSTISQFQGEAKITFDLNNGLILEANHAAEELYGYPQDELLGLPLVELLHESNRGLFNKQLKVLKEEKVFQCVSLNLRKNKTAFYGRIYLTILDADPPDKAIWFARELPATNNTKNDNLETLSKTDNDNLAAYFSPLTKPLFRLVLNQLEKLVGFTVAGIFLFEKPELKLVEYQGKYPRKDGVPVLEALLQEEYLTELIITKKPFCIDEILKNDLINEEVDQDIKDVLKESDTRLNAWMGIPILNNSEMIGVLTLLHEEPGYYTERFARQAQILVNQIAITNQRLYSQIHSMIALEERTRLARELHDSVIQTLFGIELTVRAARSLLEKGDTDQLTYKLESMLALVGEGQDEVRTLIGELQVNQTKSFSLVSELRKQVDSLKGEYQVIVRDELGDEPPIKEELKEELFLILREALLNAFKHAEASKIQIRQYYLDTNLVFETKDNGCGFNPDASYRGHYGLWSMHSRAHHLGLTLEIQSHIAQGTLVRISCPL